MISKNRISQIRKLHARKFRDESGLFLVEGYKCVEMLCASDFAVEEIFATGKAVTDNAAWLAPLSPTLITADEMSRISTMQTPPELLAIAKQRPDTQDIPDHEPLLALDHISDPGNLGTIIRIADWFGISTIICSEDTVDAWNPKVVQATMGSIARVNIIYNNLLEFLDTLPADYPVYGTLLDGDNIYTQPLTPHGLIVMGNEGNGISPEIRQKINRRLFIPSYRTDDTAESLNVAIATAITCAEFRRRENTGPASPL